MNKTIFVSIIAIALAAGTALPAFANNDDKGMRAGDIRSEWNDKRDEAREAFQEQRSDIRDERATIFNKIKDSREDLRNNIKLGWRMAIEARWKMIGAGFAQIMDRIESRITKMEADGTNVDVAKKSLAEARSAVDAARQKAEALADDANEVKLTVAQKQEARAAIEADLQTAKEALKRSVQSLIDAR